MTAHLQRTRKPEMRSHSSGRVFVEFLGERRYSKFQEGTPEAHLWYGGFVHALKTSGIEAALQYLEQDRRGKVTEPADRITLVELIAVYTEHLRGPDGTRPMEHLVRPVLKLIRTNWGREPAEKFGPSKLRTLQKLLIGEGWRRKSVNRGAQIARNLFRFGVAEELVPANVWHALQAVPGLRRGESKAKEAEPVRPAALANVEAALPFMPAQVAAIVRVTLLTAARTGEVCRMRARDLDTSGDVWVYRPSEHKGSWRGHERTIYLGPKAQEVIRPLLVPDLEAPVFRLQDAMAALRAQRHAARKTPLSCGNVPGSNRKAEPKCEPGEFFTTAVVRDAIHRACDTAGVARFNPHQLRHTRATEVRRQFGLDVARAVLGHTDATTAAIYAERDDGLSRNVAATTG